MRKYCDHLAQGVSTSTLAKMDGFPSHPTITQWIRNDEQYREMYLEAKRIQALRFADEIIEISDDREGDAARDRLRVDTRKFLMMKLLPKVFGDQMVIRGDNEAPIQHEHKHEHKFDAEAAIKRTAEILDLAKRNTAAQ